MAWTTPRTWNPGETVTASLMNSHLRDELNVLKTQVDDDGSLRVLLKGFAFSTGQGNTGGGTDQLTNYDVTIPAAYMSQPGDALLVTGTLAIATTVGTKAFYLQVGGGTQVTVMSTTSTTVSQIVPFRYLIRRRSSTTGSIAGFALITAASGGAPTVYMVATTVGTVAWGSPQTLSCYASSTGAVNNDVLLTDYFVQSVRGVTGSLV